VSVRDFLQNFISVLIIVDVFDQSGDPFHEQNRMDLQSFVVSQIFVSNIFESPEHRFVFWIGGHQPDENSKICEWTFTT
jgi:hypothetical protein